MLRPPTKHPHYTLARAARYSPGARIPSLGTSEYNASCFRGHLHECADLEWHEQQLDVRQSFLASACFELVEAREELGLDKDDVKIFVRKCDSMERPRTIGDWVALRLWDVELLDALTIGIRDADSDWVRSSCLDGITAYFNRAKQPSDPAALQRALLPLDAELRRLRTNEDVVIAETLAGARRYVWAIRRKNPGLPKPSAGDYKAYRSEENGVVEYRIERVEDGDLAVKILGVAMRERVLVIEFEPLDPALLPEDTPAVIEDTLLRGYAVGAHAAIVDEVEYADRSRHGKVTRRPPVRA